MRCADRSDSLILRRAQDEVAERASGGSRILKLLGEDHLGIAGGVEIRQRSSDLVAGRFIESSRRCVIVPTRSIDVKSAGTERERAALRLHQKAPANVAALSGFRHRDP